MHTTEKCQLTNLWLDSRGEVQLNTQVLLIFLSTYSLLNKDIKSYVLIQGTCLTSVFTRVKFTIEWDSYTCLSWLFFGKAVREVLVCTTYLCSTTFPYHKKCPILTPLADTRLNSRAEFKSVVCGNVSSTTWINSVHFEYGLRLS